MMTTVEFLNAVLSANLSADVNEKATALLAQHDKVRVSANSRKAVQHAAEVAPIVTAAREFLSDGQTHTTAEIAAACGVSTSKVSPILKKMDGVTETDVKVKGKGTVKGYTLVA